MKIGFIGLGIMGKPMAINLLKAGYSLNIYDISRKAVDEVAAYGGIPHQNPLEIAENSDVILTMLPNSPHVRQVVTGKDGILSGIKKGDIIVDMSSIDPNASIELERLVAEKGAEMIDAPVSGGEPKAIDATLSFMCGGKPETFEKVRPILEKMGASIVLVGAIGSGNMTKLANQIIVALNIAAMSEAFVLAAKSGVKPENVFNAIKGGLAGSAVLNAKASMILERNFNPGFRIELHLKDLINAINASKAVGMELPLTSAVLDMMNTLKEEGKEKCDHSALVQYYEKRENVEVKRI